MPAFCEPLRTPSVGPPGVDWSSHLFRAPGYDMGVRTIRARFEVADAVMDSERPPFDAIATVVESHQHVRR